MHISAVRAPSSLSWGRAERDFWYLPSAARAGRAASSVRSLRSAINAMHASCLFAVLALADTAHAYAVVPPPPTAGNELPADPITEFSAGISPGSWPEGIARGLAHDGARGDAGGSRSACGRRRPVAGGRAGRDRRGLSRGDRGARLMRALNTRTVHGALLAAV